MNTVQRIAKNTLFLLVSSIIGFVLSFFFLMYTTRYLGSDKYGILSFAIALSSITIFLADLGIGSVVIRDVARNRSLTEKYLWNSIFVKIILAAITITVTAAVGYIFDYPSYTMSVVYVILLSLIIVSFSSIINSIIQAYEKMEYISLGTITYNVSMLLLVLLAIYLGADVLGFAYVYLLSSIIVLSYYILVAIRKIPMLKWDINLAFWKYLVTEALPFGLSSVFVRVYYYIDTLMISIMISNPNEVMGWYNAAYRMVLILAFIPTTFLGSLYPIMSCYYATSDKYIPFMFERSFKYLMMLAIPIGVGTTILANKIVMLVYGIGYSSSTIALQILIWSEVLIFLNVVFGNLMNSINRQIIVTKQTMFCAAFNICLNLVMIPRYSYVGASVATVSTELFAFFFLLYFVSKEGYRLPKHMILHLSKILFACIIMALFIELFVNLNILLLIFISAIIYFAIILLIGVTDDVDIQLARQLVGGIKIHGRRKET